MTRSNYRGTVVSTDAMTTELAVLAKLFPIGSRIRHRGGREGTVTLDQPPNVPGTFDGRPTAWCFSDPPRGEAMLCAAWDNERGIDRWLVWVPLATVQHTSARRARDTAQLAAGGRPRPRRKGGAR